MVKRLLDTTAREVATYSREQIIASIGASEGRVLAAEVIATAMAAVQDVSNPEVAAAMGADLIVLNMLDVTQPSVDAVEATSPAEVIRRVKTLTGRLIAVNLEPVDPNADLATQDHFGSGGTSGRLATPENVAAAVALGVDAIVLTGNPGMGVTNESLARAVVTTREAAGTEIVIIAGRMHAAGSVSQSGGQIVDTAALEAFVTAGADVVMLPAPGTVPGCHEALVRSWVDTVHAAGALTMTAMGTSQEGSDEDTIRRIALMAKMTGTDIHHLGDCGFFGIALPENLMAYSIAIRGRRHTYRRMAMSLHR
ncbi:haloacid dehalogenase-like hydrolase [Frigoribacterium sp. PhB24]|uniref:DUF7916 family protein n=1 Tax=Frigoribacterium sp. PhB24 TaxID=2485204 RepID=UPI000F480307|nr:haloacid dehalogenase-like hydrolase [Frigoribacterium sp. PhB24]ROS52506.1 hypothetical protein EDF50_0969 [Frigoribacterium sp. PhB24]